LDLFPSSDEKWKGKSKGKGKGKGKGKVAPVLFLT
jgi:hypothetical protein